MFWFFWEETDASLKALYGEERKGPVSLLSWQFCYPRLHCDKRKRRDITI